MQLFYYPDLHHHTVYLPEDESKHLVKVLRKVKGEQVILADGKGNVATCIIENDHPKRCALTVVETHHHEKRNGSLHIAIAPTKQTERMDWFVEKAVEIGIDEISFMGTTNSERDKLKTERFDKIAVSAMKQSKQFWLPHIHPMQSFEDIIGLNHEHDTTKLIAWCDADKTASISEILEADNHRNIIVLIGPEGDFTVDEITRAKAAGYKPVSLGSNILRTETAGIYACTAANISLGY